GRPKAGVASRRPNSRQSGARLRRRRGAVWTGFRNRRTVAAMPVISIRHRTTYRYRNPVAFGEHRVMYRPLESFDQRVISADLEVGPEPSLLRHVQDVSGAAVAI